MHMFSDDGKQNFAISPTSAIFVIRMVLSGDK